MSYSNNCNTHHHHDQRQDTLLESPPLRLAQGEGDLEQTQAITRDWGLAFTYQDVKAVSDINNLDSLVDEMCAETMEDIGHQPISSDLQVLLSTPHHDNSEIMNCKQSPSQHYSATLPTANERTNSSLPPTPYSLLGFEDSMHDVTTDSSSWNLSDSVSSSSHPSAVSSNMSNNSTKSSFPTSKDFTPADSNTYSNWGSCAGMASCVLSTDCQGTSIITGNLTQQATNMLGIDQALQSTTEWSWPSGACFPRGNQHDYPFQLTSGEREGINFPTASLQETSSMTPQDSLQHRRPGKHRGPRTHLPEGEAKEQHKKNLAKIRAKEHHTRKKEVTSALEARVTQEEEKNRKLKEIYQSLEKMSLYNKHIYEQYIKPSYGSNAGLQ